MKVAKDIPSLKKWADDYTTMNYFGLLKTNNQAFE